jgi:hypothetical protein
VSNETPGPGGDPWAEKIAEIRNAYPEIVEELNQHWVPGLEAAQGNTESTIEMLREMTNNYEAFAQQLTKTPQGGDADFTHARMWILYGLMEQYMPEGMDIGALNDLMLSQQEQKRPTRIQQFLINNVGRLLGPIFRRLPRRR